MSKAYWIERYQKGGTSGAGSYGKFAQFKANVINKFIYDHFITTAIEFGCGDGNQLGLINYPSYLGLDISEEAIKACREKFKHDFTRKFKLTDEYRGETADIAISLEVIFHLLEDEVFERYMHRLFASANRYVIIYSSNTDVQREKQTWYVKHRMFSQWIKLNCSQWEFLEKIPTEFPFDEEGRQAGCFSDFYIYKKVTYS